MVHTGTVVQTGFLPVLCDCHRDCRFRKEDTVRENKRFEQFEQLRLTGTTKVLSLPSSLDSKKFNRFKARARLRLKTLNGRIKNFKVLSEMFRHNQSKFAITFEAIVVIVQYQMDNGSPIFYV